MNNKIFPTWNFVVIAILIAILIVIGIYLVSEIPANTKYENIDKPKVNNIRI